MLQTLTINNFKCIENETFELRPITVLTGLNSTGKSTVIQALLILLYAHNRLDYCFELIDHCTDPNIIRNKITNAKHIHIDAAVQKEAQAINLSLDIDVLENKFETNPNQNASHAISPIYSLDENLYYLFAGRFGGDEMHRISMHQAKVGKHAEFLFGHYHLIKNMPLSPDLIKFDDSYTLSYQVDGWLSFITGVKTRFETTKEDGNKVKASFSSNGIDHLSPMNIGTGFSYIVQILVICLQAKKGDLVIIENPEIHLHPKAQALLGTFFSFIANAGIQLIIETHSEHLMHKLCFEVFEKNITPNDVVIYYKSEIIKPFEKILIAQNGAYTNNDAKPINFPEGFFDASYNDIIQMG